MGLCLPSDSSFASNHCYNVDIVTSCPQGSLWPTPLEETDSSFGAIARGTSAIQMDDVWEENTEDLAELFGRLGLGKYTDLFQQQEVSELYVLNFFDFSFNLSMPIPQR